MKDYSIFGKLIRKERERKKLPLWQFAAKIPFPQSNVSRIELGLSEPRIGLVMKMLNALEIPSGVCLHKLAEELDICKNQKYERVASDVPLLELTRDICTDASDSSAVIFGILLKTARLANDKTQVQVAEAAGYTTGSLILVEKGRREPGLMSALKLVAGVGCNIKEFFGVYERLLRQK